MTGVEVVYVYIFYSVIKKRNKNVHFLELACVLSQSAKFSFIFEVNLEGLNIHKMLNVEMRTREAGWSQEFSCCLF